MAIPVFKDYDPANPFAVSGETHTVKGGRVRLDHTPLKGSVTIDGFTENTKTYPAKGEFYIDYQAANDYVTATQLVVFNDADEGKEVTVSYQGVSTIIFARHFIEIWDAIENAASKLTNLMTLVSGLPKFAIQPVDSLPTKDISETTIYLLKTGDKSQNLYTEYLYVNGKWEIIGAQEMDLSGYAKKTDLSDYALKSALSDYALKTALSDYALKTELSAYALKTALSGYLPLTGGTLTGNLKITGGGLDATLVNARTIDGVKFDASQDINHFGISDTAGNIVTKEVTVPGFVLGTGAQAVVKFREDNTANNPKLDVNATGGRDIFYCDEAIDADWIIKNGVYLFVYNGAQYELLSGGGVSSKIVIPGIPYTDSELIYDGSVLAPVWNDYYPDMVTVSGTMEATAAGTYTVTFTPRPGYKWPDGSTGPITVTWVILAHAPRKMTVVIDLSNSDPAACCTYADDAIGMTAGSSDWDEFFGHYPVMLKDGVEGKKLNPENFAQHEDGTTADITSGDEGDVMIAFPRRGLVIKTEGNTLTISMTETKNTSSFKYYAHQRGSSDKDIFYLGAYSSKVVSSRLRSLSSGAVNSNNGGTFTSGTTPMSVIREYAHNNIAPNGKGGSGYDMMGFYQLTYIQAMFILKYKTLNSQSAIGRGYIIATRSQATGSSSYTTSSSYPNRGSMNSRGMDYGSNSGAKIFGLEHFWGSMSCLYEGLYIDSNRNIWTATDNFNNNGSGYTNRLVTMGTSSSSATYLRAPQGTTELGFLPKTHGGSQSTYFCDYAAATNSNCVRSHGGQLDAYILYNPTTKTSSAQNAGRMGIFSGADSTKNTPITVATTSAPSTRLMYL